MIPSTRLCGREGGRGGSVREGVWEGERREGGNRRIGRRGSVCVSGEGKSRGERRWVEEDESV